MSLSKQSSDFNTGHHMTVFSTSFRVIGTLMLFAFVAACGGREPPVRSAPQAVHPSTSALAQGTVSTPSATSSAPATQYTPNANDGSQPIID